jgi:hypothetical protein
MKRRGPPLGASAPTPDAGEGNSPTAEVTDIAVEALGQPRPIREAAPTGRLSWTAQRPRSPDHRGAGGATGVHAAGGTGPLFLAGRVVGSLASPREQHSQPRVSNQLPTKLRRLLSHR